MFLFNQILALKFKPSPRHCPTPRFMVNAVNGTVFPHPHPGLRVQGAYCRRHLPLAGEWISRPDCIHHVRNHRSGCDGPAH